MEKDMEAEIMSIKSRYESKINKMKQSLGLIKKLESKGQSVKVKSSSPNKNK